jgi:O-antigen ligase
MNCSLFVLSSLYLRNAIPSSRRLFSLFALAGLVLLVLTRSRTSFAALLVAVVAYLYLATPEVEKKVVAVVLCGVLLMGLVVIGDAAAVKSGLFLGRASEGNLDTLNGRIWVWMACRGYAGRRPIFGYGFHGFWTPDRIREFSTNQGWTLGSAHSIYIDMILSLGMVGFVAFAALLVLSMRKTLVGARRIRDPAPAFLFAFLVYYGLHGLLESVFINPGYFVFASMIVFAKVAFFPVQSGDHTGTPTGVELRQPDAHAEGGTGRHGGPAPVDHLRRLGCA